MTSGLRTRRRRRPELPLVPLIDVLVMLVLFAFVTMRFSASQTLKINLPKIETAGKNASARSVTIAIDKAGNIALDGKVVQESQLVALLEQIHSINRDIPVMIRADQDIPLKKLTFVMDTCRKIGLNKFSLQSSQ